jgi:hypothetical protein
VLEATEELVAPCADEEHVLETDASPTRDVDCRLDRDHHPLLDHVCAAGDDLRRLAPGRAEPMAGVMLVDGVAEVGERLAWAVGVPHVALAVV